MFDLKRRLYGPATLILPADVIEKRQVHLAESDFRSAGIVFIHIPKTAGLCVVQSLYHCDALRHFTLAQFLQVGAADLQALPRFATVRNPWDRAVSAYHFATRGGVPGGAQMMHAHRYRRPAFATFETFVTDYLAVRNVWKLDGVFRPQSYYLGTDNRMLDHIGRFACLAETETWLSNRLERPVVFTRSNATPHDDYRSYYSDTTRRIVADAYRADIERFELEF